MFKLKLSIWLSPHSDKERIHLGIAFDHKSFAAMEHAIRSGCFGMASKTKYWTEYVDPSYGVALTPLFEKKKGRLVSVLPFVVADNWLESAKELAISNRKINKSSKRSFVATEWDLVPFNFVNLNDALAS
jgi:hypothetical protein